jgi:hypothetical protein
MAVINPGILANAGNNLPMPDSTKALADSYSLSGQRMGMEEQARVQKNVVNDQNLLTQYLRDGGWGSS